MREVVAEKILLLFLVFSWPGATKVSTVLDSGGYYVSRAAFAATEAGRYAVTYTITMAAGKGAISWIGTGSTTLTVLDTNRDAPGGGGESGWPGF